MQGKPKTYRERREAKADQLRMWADGREAKADAAYEGVQSITERIPFGQPILVGHHSERGARADQRRIQSGMDKSCEHSAKAAEMRSRADNIEAAAKHAIYSDDPDALEALTAKLEALEAQRDRIKAYNRTCKAGQDHGDLSLLSEAQQRDLLTTMRVQAYACKNGRFPSYVLSNLGGVISNTRKRIESLSKPEAGRWLVARYAGECRDCGATIEAGERCTYYKRTRELVCQACES